MADSEPSPNNKLVRFRGSAIKERSMEPDTGKNPAEEALAKTPAPPKQPKKTANMQKQGLVSEGALKRAKKKLGVKDTDGDGEVDHGEDAPKPKNSKADNAIEGKVAVTNADDDD